MGSNSDVHAREPQLGVKQAGIFRTALPKVNNSGLLLSVFVRLAVTNCQPGREAHQVHAARYELVLILRGRSRAAVRLFFVLVAPVRELQVSSRHNLLVRPKSGYPWLVKRYPRSM